MYLVIPDIIIAIFLLLIHELNILLYIHQYPLNYSPASTIESEILSSDL